MSPEGHLPFVSHAVHGFGCSSVKYLRRSRMPVAAPTWDRRRMEVGTLPAGLDAWMTCYVVLTVPMTLAYLDLKVCPDW